MSYRIGSYNVGGPMPLLFTDAEAVSSVIENHSFDIVAFQDMHASAEIVDNFCSKVCSYLYGYDNHSSRGPSADRSFAFLWNTNKVDLIDMPFIYDKYRGRSVDEWSFKRDPLLGRFITRIGIGVKSATLRLGLDFIPMYSERYDLVFLGRITKTPVWRQFLSILTSPGSQTPSASKAATTQL